MDFLYSQSQNSRTQIRLLELDLARSSDQDIFATLATFKTQAAPPYVAISYTWGDQTKRRDVVINERRLSVTQNTWYALWQVFNARTDSFIWIDAICINQLDSLEKSHQVGLMSAISSGATCVYACIGPHYDDSKFICREI
jgi:hypothetical protein